MKKNENYYQKKFFNFVNSHDFFLGSTFLKEVPLFYCSNKPERIKSKTMPYSQTDFIEIDENGKFHLWEAKMLDADELVKGKTLGQLLFYDFLFNTYPEENLKALLKKEGMKKEQLESMTFDDFKFSSWNILVCGGKGWELAAGVNPVIWNYVNLPEKYFFDETPNINLFHFFNVSDGYDLKNIWELSINKPRYMHIESLIDYQEISIEEDGVDITKDELNNLSYEIKYEIQLGALLAQSDISDQELEIFSHFHESEDKELFLRDNDISKDQIDIIDKLYTKVIESLFLDEDDVREAHSHFNRFIGREWFNENHVKKVIFNEEDEYYYR